jgi:hypothetical protein
LKLATDARAGVLGFDPQAGEAILKSRDFITILRGAAATWRAKLSIAIIRFQSYTEHNLTGGA